MADFFARGGFDTGNLPLPRGKGGKRGFNPLCGHGAGLLKKRNQGRQGGKLEGLGGAAKSQCGGRKTGD